MCSQPQLPPVRFHQRSVFRSVQLCRCCSIPAHDQWWQFSFYVSLKSPVMSGVRSFKAARRSFLLVFTCLFRPLWWISSWLWLASRAEWNKRYLRNLFYPPLHMEKAALSLKRAALSPNQDTSVAVVPGQQQATITPGSPTCRSMTRCCQWYPPPAPVAIRPLPQVLTSVTHHHTQWIIVRKACATDPTPCFLIDHCLQAQ